MSPAKAGPVALAILAKAPVPGYAKTRLVPVIGAHAAAVLQERLTERTTETAVAAAVGPVTLWGAPNHAHRSFTELAGRFPVRLKPQPDGDLGDRILAAMAAAGGRALVIGSDCPALTPKHLQAAAAALDDADAVAIPAEDGGYVLIGARVPIPSLMTEMTWSTSQVMEETRRRAAASGLRLREFSPLWDVDDAADLDRLDREHPDLAL